MRFKDPEQQQKVTYILRTQSSDSEVRVLSRIQCLARIFQRESGQQRRESQRCLLHDSKLVKAIIYQIRNYLSQITKARELSMDRVLGLQQLPQRL